MAIQRPCHTIQPIVSTCWAGTCPAMFQTSINYFQHYALYLTTSTSLAFCANGLFCTTRPKVVPSCLSFVYPRFLAQLWSPNNSVGRMISFSWRIFSCIQWGMKYSMQTCTRNKGFTNKFFSALE